MMKDRQKIIFYEYFMKSREKGEEKLVRDGFIK